MSLAQVIDRIVTLTERPDARAKALLSLNSLIQDICNNADYPEDLVETSLQNPTPGSYTLTLELGSPDLPPIRKIEYIVAGGVPIKAVKPRNAVLETGCSPANTFYRAGTRAHINASNPVQVVYLGYYQQVGWLAETSEHWLEQAAPQVLVLGTAAAVFRATGDDVSASEYETQYRLARRQFRTMLVDTEEI